MRLRYQVLDESTLPKKPAELTMYIADASGARIQTWNLGYLQTKENKEGMTTEKWQNILILQGHMDQGKNKEIKIVAKG